MTATNKPEQRASRERYVYSIRPRCPECGSVRLLAYRTLDNGDGSITRYVRCGECGERLVLVLE